MISTLIPNRVSLYVRPANSIDLHSLSNRERLYSVIGEWWEKQYEQCSPDVRFRGEAQSEAIQNRLKGNSNATLILTWLQGDPKAIRKQFKWSNSNDPKTMCQPRNKAIEQSNWITSCDPQSFSMKNFSPEIQTNKFLIGNFNRQFLV